MKRHVHLSAPWTGQDEIDAVTVCVRANALSPGAAVEQLEERYAAWVGAEYCVTCCSGTAALRLALLALGAKGNVACPALTFVATANAIVQAGATPYFTDVDPTSWCWVPPPRDRYAYAVPVALYGDLPLPAKPGCPSVVDAAQCQLPGVHARLGALVSTYSFYGNKILACGGGGAVCTNDQRLAEQIRTLSGHGMYPRSDGLQLFAGADEACWSERLTELQAAVLLAQLERAPEILERRQAIVEAYRARLEICNRPETAPWLVNVRVPERHRTEIMFLMDRAGVETRAVFTPMHKLAVHKRDWESYPVAEAIGASGISLPTHPLMTEDDVKHVVAVFEEAVDKAARRAAA